MLEDSGSFFVLNNKKKKRRTTLKALHICIIMIPCKRMWRFVDHGLTHNSL